MYKTYNLFDMSYFLIGDKSTSVYDSQLFEFFLQYLREMSFNMAPVIFLYPQTLLRYLGFRVITPQTGNMTYGAPCILHRYGLRESTNVR